MCTITGFFRRDCVLVNIMALGPKAGLLEGNLFSVGQYDPPHPPPSPPNLDFVRRTNPILILIYLHRILKQPI